MFCWSSYEINCCPMVGEENYLVICIFAPNLRRICWLFLQAYCSTCTEISVSYLTHLCAGATAGVWAFNLQIRGQYLQNLLSNRSFLPPLVSMFVVCFYVVILSTHYIDKRNEKNGQIGHSFHQFGWRTSVKSPEKYRFDFKWLLTMYLIVENFAQ